MRTLVIYKSKLHIYTKTSFSPSLFVLTRVLDIGCAIHSCVVVATQRMHGQAFVASRYVLGRQSRWQGSKSVQERAANVAAIVAVISVWCSFMSVGELWLFDSTGRTIRIDRSFSDNVCFSNIAPQCWEATRPDTAKHNSKNPAEPGCTWVKSKRVATTPMKDKLLSDEWSVPMVGCIAELKVGEPGVCLVWSSEARKTIQKLKSDHTWAILSPSNVDNREEELHVLMEDASDRVVVRRRFWCNWALAPLHTCTANRKSNANQTMWK